MKMNWLKHPVKTYKKHMKNSIIPKPYSHQVKMDIVIKKGQRMGTALIPCTIYAMDHSIDMNPALIRKKDKKTLTYIQPKKKYKYVKDEDLKAPYYEIKGKEIRYNPIHIMVELTDEEKKQGYGMCKNHGEVKKVEYREFERCDKCHQKLVISEVSQTRYRSCPSIHVKLGDKAKDDTVVPVQFGVNKSDITAMYWFIPILLLGCIVYTLTVLGFPVVLNTISTMLSWIPTPTSVSSVWASISTKVLTGIVLLFIWAYLVPRSLYKAYMLLKWYRQVKEYMVRSPYKVQA